MNTYYLGIDIGGTKTAYGLFDCDRQLMARGETPTDANADGESFFSGIAGEIRRWMAKAIAMDGQVAGIGIGITGFVDYDRGALSVTASLPRLNFFPVSDYLKSALNVDIPIRLDNDCHCGALAEYRRGAGRGHRHMLYCPVSTGISTGIIIDGKLFRGSNGASGESGHMLSGVEGPLRIPCSCGNEGCFNSLASGKAIVSHVRRWIEAGEVTVMTTLAESAEAITAREINAAYDMGDPLAIRAVEQMAHYLAIWIFDVYMLLNVDCIVFSGGLLNMGEKLFGRIRDEFEHYHTNGFPVSFHSTALGADSGLIGAVELLFDN